MARTDNLTNFLTDVADSIREKKGTSEPILASDFDTEISSIETSGSTEYEYAEFDPFNVFEILDNDTEPCVGKKILLLINNGTNTLTISGNIFKNATKIKTSDGQVFERGATETITITFDPSKDAINKLGTPVRYLIAYTQEKTTVNLYDRDQIELSKKVLIYYFKNYDLKFGLSSILYDSAITKLIKYDDNSTFLPQSSSFAERSKTLIEFESKTPNVGNKLEYAFQGTRALKKLKINLEGATSVYYLCSSSYSVEEVEFYNCPETAINQSNALAQCYNLKKFKAVPYFIVSDSSFFNNYTNGGMLQEISGVDFSTASGDVGGCKNLVKLERIKNVGVNLYLTNVVLLSLDSLLNVINALEDATGQTAKTMTFGPTNLGKLEQTEEGQQAIALAVSKNWTIG